MSIINKILEKLKEKKGKSRELSHYRAYGNNSIDWAQLDLTEKNQLEYEKFFTRLDKVLKDENSSPV